MKPFNLEKALAGEPVVMQDGTPVKIAGYDPAAKHTQCVLFWDANGIGRGATELGKVGYVDMLFMAPTERKEWVILWANTHGGRQSHVVNFLENAQEYKEFLYGRNFTDISIHEITIHD